MADSYRSITPELARRIRLVMADVDGTIVSGGGPVSPEVSRVVCRLQEQGIMVGVVSGRTVGTGLTPPGLAPVLEQLDLQGPVIAENGGVAMLTSHGPLLDMGYSREPALMALRKLRSVFPALGVRQDNSHRVMDVVILHRGLTVEELGKHVDGVEFHRPSPDSPTLHVMQKGINKAKTLVRLLDKVADATLSRDETLVFGDSLTDMPLFRLFPHSVLIRNPHLRHEQRRGLESAAAYVSDLFDGEGFAQVVAHLLAARGV